MTTAKVPTRLRWLLWLPLLGVSAWLALSNDGPPAAATSAVSEPVRRAPAREGAAAFADPSVLVPRERLIAAAAKEPLRDLFAPRSWTPPPPPPPPPAEVKPSAPALPFTYLGKKREGAEWEVYLARGDQTLIVRAGATIDGTYRVERAEPPELLLTYLPLNQPQTLPIGDPQ